MTGDRGVKSRMMCSRTVAAMMSGGWLCDEEFLSRLASFRFLFLCQFVSNKFHVDKLKHVNFSHLSMMGVCLRGHVLFLAQFSCCCINLL